MNIKLAGVGVLAAGAVGVLAWQGFSNLGPREIRSASQAQQGVGSIAGDPESFEDVREGPDGRRLELGGPSGPPPAWVAEAPDSSIERYDFPKSGDAIAALDLAPTILAAKFDEDATMSAVSAKGRLDAVDSWLAFIRPLVAGDEEAFIASVARLGGVTEPNDEGEVPASRLYGRLSGMFESAPIALEQASIRSADASDRRDVPRPMEMPGMDIKPGMVMMMMIQIESMDPETGESITREALSIPLQGMFPSAGEAAANGANVVEVWAPAKVKGSGGKDPDLGTSVFLVWNGRENAWQPVALRIAFLSTKGREKLNMSR